MDLWDNTFMLAGPVKIHPRVLSAMSVPSMAHRSEEFSQVIGEIADLLKYLFQSDRDVAIITGSGTAGIEAAIANLVNKDDRILILNNGKFGERLYRISKVYSNATEVKAEWGCAFDLEEVEAHLETCEYKALALCHNETSTGMTNDAEGIGRITEKHDVIFILDGITSVGGLDVNPERIGADIVLFGSQKCIAAPAGLAALSISERALDAMYDDTTYYLNLRKHVQELNSRNQTPWTPAIPLFLAFREALRMVEEEGLERRIERIRRIAEATRGAVKALGLQLFPDERYASDTLTAIKYPVDIRDTDFRSLLWKKYDVIVAGSQKPRKGEFFRIGHMGIVKWTDILATFGAIEAVLSELGYDVEPGVSTGEIVRRMVT